MRPLSPCLDCADRHLGCHADCGRYLDFKNKSEEFKQIINDVKDKENLAFSYEISDKRKKMKKRGIK